MKVKTFDSFSEHSDSVPMTERKQNENHSPHVTARNRKAHRGVKMKTFHHMSQLEIEKVLENEIGKLAESDQKPVKRTVKIFLKQSDGQIFQVLGWGAGCEIWAEICESKK
jgi:hypothetical protein